MKKYIKLLLFFALASCKVNAAESVIGEINTCIGKLQDKSITISGKNIYNIANKYNVIKMQSNALTQFSTDASKAFSNLKNNKPDTPTPGEHKLTPGELVNAYNYLSQNGWIPGPGMGCCSSTDSGPDELASLVKNLFKGKACTLGSKSNAVIAGSVYTTVPFNSQQSAITGSSGWGGSTACGSQIPEPYCCSGSTSSNFFECNNILYALSNCPISFNKKNNSFIPNACGSSLSSGLNKAVNSCKLVASTNIANLNQTINFQFYKLNNYLWWLAYSLKKIKDDPDKKFETGVGPYTDYTIKKKPKYLFNRYFKVDKLKKFKGNKTINEILTAYNKSGATHISPDQKKEIYEYVDKYMYSYLRPEYVFENRILKYNQQASFLRSTALSIYINYFIETIINNVLNKSCKSDLSESAKSVLNLDKKIKDADNVVKTFNLANMYIMGYMMSKMILGMVGVNIDITGGIKSAFKKIFGEYPEKAFKALKTRLKGKPEESALDDIDDAKADFDVPSISMEDLENAASTVGDAGSISSAQSITDGLIGSPPEVVPPGTGKIPDTPGEGDDLPSGLDDLKALEEAAQSAEDLDG